MILETAVRAVDTFEVRGRGRLNPVVVEAGYIPFVVALSGADRQLWVGATRVERFEVPRVGGAAHAFGSFGSFDAAAIPACEVGDQVTVVQVARTATG